MDGILGLLGSGSGESLVSSLLGSVLGGGGSDPLSALLGGGQNHSQGDTISQIGKAASTIMDVASIAAMFV